MRPKAYFAALLTAGCVLTLGGLPAQADPSQAVPTTADQAYPAESTAQCSKPLTERVGNWTCYTTTAAGADAVKQHSRKALGAQAVPQRDLQAAAAAYCTTGGCWDQIDTARSTYSGTGSYGYGSTALGSTELYFKTTSSGSKTVTYPLWFSSSRGTKSIVLSNEHLYLSTTYPGGNSQDPRKYYQKSFSTGSAGISSQWSSPGPGTTDSVAWLSVVSEATWSDPSSRYPGSWYMYAKSIKLKKQSNGSYYVQADNALPSSPRGAGYRS
jgi:hypothetical protein